VTVGPSEDPPDDDRTIDDHTPLYRRVPPAQWKEVGDEYVVRDGAFKNFPHPERKRMSVVLADTLEQLDRDTESVRGDEPNYGVIAITAKAARDEEQRIERSPRYDEPAHGDVYGDKPPGRRKKFAAQAEWVVYPA
jgi:hypothetical protein